MIPRRPVVIANEIRLKRSQLKGAFLVVEGRDDRLFCERFIDASVNIVVAEGKTNVCEVISILDDDHFLGAVGMVDADFDRIEGNEWPSANIILSETHDLETMLIQSSALERVLVEFGSSEKRAASGREVRDVLLAAALPIGYLRLHARRAGLDLRFQGLRYARCIDQESLEINRLALIEEVKRRSQRPELLSHELEESMQMLERMDYDPWQVCAGDDLVSLLGLGLQKALGANNATTVKDEVLRRSLRLAYDDNTFTRSQLSRAFREWEMSHADFRLLRYNGG